MLEKFWQFRADRRTRKRHREKLERLENCDVVFLSPAKSGRTWLRAMASHVYHHRYGTPIDDLIDNDNFKKIDPRLPSIHFSHEVNEVPPVRAALANGILREKHTVILVRDPRDTVASRYFQHKHRRFRQLKKAGNQAVDFGAMTPFEFAVDRRHGIGVIIETLNWLTRVRHQTLGTLCLRYEDVMADPSTALRNLLSFVGTPAEPGDIEAAVAFGRFDHLQKLEGRQFFESERLQPVDPGNTETYKVRRGEVGGYRHDFSPDEIAALDDIIDRRLNAGFGYRRDEEMDCRLPAGI